MRVSDKSVVSTSLRFEFDMSLEEAGTRKLDVAVKNNRMFHTRERKEIGMVGSNSRDVKGLGCCTVTMEL